MTRLRTAIPLEHQKILEFSERFRISPVASQLFLRRGITSPQEVKFFIEDDLRFAHNPFLFHQMEDVVERINQAVEEGEHILVFGDRDVDGITSTTIITRFLRAQGAKVSTRLPIDDDPYGLSEKAVHEFAQDSGTLIITVDCGITNLDEIVLAQGLGIDVIIIDHHNIPEVIPPAVAIINPKELDSGYPFQGLSAAALCAKVVWALEFSKSAFYNQDFCLIHCTPANDSLYFDALIVRNFVPSKSIRETLALESTSAVRDKILRFIEHYPLFIFEKEVQLKYLKQILGNVDIAVHDIAEDLFNKHPSISGKSLIRIIAQSKSARYQSEVPNEIDGLFQIFTVVHGQHLSNADNELKEALPYVSLSLVADMMPMKNENRILMKQGLFAINQGLEKHFGLQALLVELELRQKKIQVKDIGWRIAPLLNSSGRMGRPDLALELLLSNDPSLCNANLQKLTDFNTLRKKLGDGAWKRVQSNIESIKSEYEGKILLIVDEEIPRGITGILAGRISREYNISAIVIAHLSDRYIGSIRTANGLKATWLLDSCSHILKDFGGHDAAGGFYMELSDLEEFKTTVRRALGEWNPDKIESQKNSVDIEIEAAELDESHWDLTSIFTPHGQEFPQPTVLIKNIQLQSINPLGRESRHLTLECLAKSRVWNGIIWDGSIPPPFDFKTGDHVDCLVMLEKNQWRTTLTPQLIIQDIARID